MTSLAADETYNTPQVNNVFREDVLEEPQPEPFPEVVIRTSQGDIRLKLDAESAPETVDNFLKNYVDRDYYSGTIFHFVDPAFIVMAGGYTPDLQRAEPRSPIRNESHNGRKNLRGTIGMSRHPEYADSATCEFFINVKDNPTLDHSGTEEAPVAGYCVFGEVVSGMDVVDRIASAPVKNEGNFVNLPTEAIVIQSIERVK
jgi:cyclophilin family peptidyl-prolyl cis-trans isomerase